MREVWFNYDKLQIYAITYSSEVEGQGDTWTDYRIDIKTDLIV